MGMGGAIPIRDSAPSREIARPEKQWDPSPRVPILDKTETATPLPQ